MLSRWRSGFLQVREKVAALWNRYVMPLWRFLCSRVFGHRNRQMPSETFRAIRLKTDRPVENLEYFKANYLGLSGPVVPPNAVGVHLHDDRQGITIDTQSLEPAQQRRLGILLGEVIHQARSSLDHVVYALATRGGKT